MSEIMTLSNGDRVLFDYGAYRDGRTKITVSLVTGNSEDGTLCIYHGVSDNGADALKRAYTKARKGK